MANYDSAFFDYVNSGALKSAEAILPLIKEHLEINSVLDAGCGQGGWIAIWKKLGVKTVHGIDGDYVVREELLVDTSEFSAFDLSKPFELNKKFDLAQSLEVGEHLPTASSADFVASLVGHSDIVLFSAAARGQGGDSHINEQDYEFWRQHFAKHDYVAIDYVRPLILENTDIEQWYRYNPFLYVARAKLAELPQVLQKCVVPDDEPLKDLSPALYKMRKALVKLLPVSVATKIAKMKEAMTVKKRSQAKAT
ncbi:MAG: methyltransferase domain-containing protein [Opitutaceae bacterium]